jgi:hypothetical protein
MTTMSDYKENYEYIERLIKREIGGVDDNLARANLMAKTHPLDKQYGQSGQTLGEIIEGYEAAKRRPEKALEWLKEKLG